MDLPNIFVSHFPPEVPKRIIPTKLWEKIYIYIYIIVFDVGGLARYFQVGSTKCQI